MILYNINILFIAPKKEVYYLIVNPFIVPWSLISILSISFAFTGKANAKNNKITLKINIFRFTLFYSIFTSSVK